MEIFSIQVYKHVSALNETWSLPFSKSHSFFIAILNIIGSTGNFSILLFVFNVFFQIFLKFDMRGTFAQLYYVYPILLFLSSKNPTTSKFYYILYAFSLIKLSTTEFSATCIAAEGIECLESGNQTFTREIPCLWTWDAVLVLSKGAQL